MVTLKCVDLILPHKSVKAVKIFDTHIINFCYEIIDNCYVLSTENKDAIKRIALLLSKKKCVLCYYLHTDDVHA